MRENRAIQHRRLTKLNWGFRASRSDVQSLSLHFFLVVFCCLATTLVFADEMELHLVLAFDASASVNDVEFDLQRRGTASALRSDAVSAAIEEAPGGVAIAIIQWSSITRQMVGMDWAALHTRDDAVAFADAVDAMPRNLPGGSTMIHAGLEFAARLFSTAPGSARRQVIDISGNGVADDLEPLLLTRQKLLSRNIVINGLAIEEDDLPITSYYAHNVIGGRDAFVITANDFGDFARAMEMKLLREVGGAVFAGRN